MENDERRSSRVQADWRNQIEKNDFYDQTVTNQIEKQKKQWNGSNFPHYYLTANELKKFLENKVKKEALILKLKQDDPERFNNAKEILNYSAESQIDKEVEYFLENNRKWPPIDTKKKQEIPYYYGFDFDNDDDIDEPAESNDVNVSTMEVLPTQPSPRKPPPPRGVIIRPPPSTPPSRRKLMPRNFIHHYGKDEVRGGKKIKSKRLKRQKTRRRSRLRSRSRTLR